MSMIKVVVIAAVMCAVAFAASCPAWLKTPEAFATFRKDNGCDVTSSTSVSVVSSATTICDTGACSSGCAKAMLAASPADLAECTPTNAIMNGSLLEAGLAPCRACGSAAGASVAIAAVAAVFAMLA